MWKKIKAFFELKTVKIIEAVIMALAAAGLIIGGVSIDTIKTVPTVTLGVITALEALITFIQGITTVKAVE